MDIKLLAIDLDGTTVTGNHKISKQNLEAIQQVLARNILVVIATGRGPSRINKIYNKLHLQTYNLPIICFNGATTYNYATNQFTNTFAIENSIALEIFKLAQKYKISIWGYSDNNKDIYHVNKFSMTKYFVLKFYKLNNIKFNCDNFKGNILKFSFLCSTKKEKLFFELLKKYNLKIFCQQFHLTNQRMWDLTSLKCDKYNAIYKLAQANNIDNKNIMTIGDGENDLMMIKNAGLGIAMGNAVKIVKKNSNYVTDKVQKNGLAKAIWKFILNKE